MVRRASKSQNRHQVPLLPELRSTPKAAAREHPSLAHAAELVRLGRLDEAEKLLRGILSFAPRNHVAFHLLGTVAQQKGNSGGAIDFFRRAITANNRIVAYHADLGMAYLEARRLGEAEGCFRRVLDSILDRHQGYLGSVQRCSGERLMPMR